jgi:hypothetical protein
MILRLTLLAARRPNAPRTLSLRQRTGRERRGDVVLGCDDAGVRYLHLDRARLAVDDSGRAELREQIHHRLVRCEHERSEARDPASRARAQTAIIAS